MALPVFAFMINSYKKASKYLESLVPPASASQVMMPIASIRSLCDLWGSPHTKYPIIHVGGTSGKTSTATFAAAILKETGFTTGLHISPHLETDTERMQINGNNIPEKEFVALLKELLKLVRKTNFKKKHGKISRFGVLVAMTFKYFERKKVDVGVIEVGLGGKLDGTNIIPSSVAILTNVSLDHTEILGKTVQKIAKDKMGIIKPEAPAVISAVSQPSIRKLLTARCKELGVPLFLLGRNFRLRQNSLSAQGEFQHENFTLAAEAVTQFVHIYFPKFDERVKNAIQTTAKKTIISGRMEIISQDPLVLLDGAHNGAKMRAFLTSLKKSYPGQKWLCILAVKKGKMHTQLVRTIEPLVHEFIFTRFTSDIPDTVYTATEPIVLAESTGKPYRLIPEAKKAIHEAIKMSRKSKVPILVTGSLYLVGEIRGLVRKVTPYKV